MYGVEKKPDASVGLGDGVVVVKRKGITRPVVANVLSLERSSGNNVERTRVVLDRLVHKPHETDLGEWSVSGAYVSVLELERAVSLC
jgi:hypothetical protein